MTVGDFYYYNNYKNNLNKFIFEGGKDITTKEYIGLTNEVRDIEKILDNYKKDFAVTQ